MRISEREEQRFELKSDPSGEAFIIVRQASFGESRKLADLTATQRQVYNEGPRGNKVAYEQDFNVFEEKAAMIFLTAVEIGGFTIDRKNAKGEVEEIDLFAMIGRDNLRRNIKSMGAFQADLDELDDAVVTEMHECVLRLNPQWDPNARRS